MSILKEGFPFIIPSLLAGIVLLVVSKFVTALPADIVCVALGSLLVIFALFCVFFFRDPKIAITQAFRSDGEPAVSVLSPCNGTVMEVIEGGEPALSANSGKSTVCAKSGEKIIRVFLSIFSVHLQRSPVDGTVTDVIHKDGKFYAAWNPLAHIENEQNVITIQSADGVYTVRQIAGFLARRCVSWVKAGDVLKAGDKIGMIKFSSQVDLHLPASAQIKVKAGDKVKAGVTVVA